MLALHGLSGRSYEMAESILIFRNLPFPKVFWDSDIDLSCG